MSHCDEFMQAEFLPFCQRASEAYEQNHQKLYETLKSFLSDKSLIGMRLMKNDNVLGDYTVVLENAKIIRIDNGVLSSEIHTPLGVIKPYYIIEMSALEKMIKDEANFIAHSFSTELKFYPEFTLSG